MDSWIMLLDGEDDGLALLREQARQAQAEDLDFQGYEPDDIDAILTYN